MWTTYLFFTIMDILWFFSVVAGSAVSIVILASLGEALGLDNGWGGK